MAGQGNGSEKQLKKLKTEMEKEKLLLKGDNWYLVDNSWSQKLKSYLASSSRLRNEYHPGPVNNKPLFKADGSDIRDHMNEKQHYVLVSEDVWELLVNMFGIIEGQEPVKRKVAEYGGYHYKVEVYYIEFLIANADNLENIEKKKFSNCDTIKQIQQIMKQQFNISHTEKTRLWKKSTANNSWQKLPDWQEDEPVHDVGLRNEQLIVIETMNHDAKWPTKWNMDNRSTVCYTSDSVGAPTVRGNTSRLSQIANQLEAAQIFESRVEATRKDLKKKHKSELNKVMEKQSKETDAFERDCVTNIKKQRELEKQLQGLILPVPASSTPKCPVCMESMAGARIFQCPNGHLVCGACKPRLTVCTICRKEYMGRATAMEQMLRDIFKT